MLRKLSLPSLFFFSIAIFFLIFIHLHGFISYDDGWFLQGAKRIIDGEIPYRNFEFLYNPGGLYLNAIGFLLFGQSILASRIVALINSLIAVFLIYLVGRKIKLNKYLVFTLIFSYIFWAPGHINFVWPVVFCLTLAIVTGFLFLKNSETKSNSKLILLVGFLSALTFLIKQNFGLAIFLADIVLLILLKKYRNLKSFLNFFLGHAIVIFLQLLYFLKTESLVIYLKQIYYFTYIKIFKEGILNSPLPWEYPGNILFKIAKTGFYALPLIISIYAFLIIFRKKKNDILLFFPLVSIFYYLFSIRPTTDFVHLPPLIAVSLIPLVLISLYEKRRLIKLGSLVLLIGFLTLGFYSTFFQSYYRWHPPLIKNNYFINGPRVNIWTDKSEAESIKQAIKYFGEHAKNEEYTFVYNFSPAYYQILNKKNPTPYDYMHWGVLTNEVEINTVKILKQKRIVHLITDENAYKKQTEIGDFIKKNYKKELIINKITIWKLL